MKNKDIENMLQTSRAPKPTHELPANFTQKVLDDITADIAEHPPKKKREWWQRYLRPTNWRALPKAAVVACLALAVFTTGGIAYAAYQWLSPKITITHINPNNDDNKREFVVDIKNCGVMAGGETANNGLQRYEVARDSNLTDEQVMKVLKTSCEYQRILQFVNTEWSQGPSPGHKPGDNVTIIAAGTGGDNVFNDPSLGAITALSDTSITIESKIYQRYKGPNAITPENPIPGSSTLMEYFPEGKRLSRTFDLLPMLEVVENGQPIDREQLKVGDTVFFMSEVKRTIMADGTWSEPASIKVARLLKTAIDPEYVQPIGVGNPAIVGAVTRLDTCQGNSDYLCMASKQQYVRHEMIYVLSQFQDARLDKRFEENNKYFRTDLTPQTITSEHFHQIEGRIKSINGAILTLQSRGKAEIFTVTLPYDAVVEFNRDKNEKISMGDMVQVNYAQQPGENVRHIKSGDIMSLSLLQRQLADGTFKKY